MSEEILRKLQLLDLVLKWARWRQGQCDFPKGLSDEEKALYELVEGLL